MTEHGNCPSCGNDMDGDLIYDIGLLIHKSEEHALKYAEAYGAAKTTGRWDRRIGIYDRDKDRTIAYLCPDCGIEIAKAGDI